MQATTSQKIAPKISVRHEGVVRFHAIDHSPFTIGRLEDNDISLPDPQLSRRHAEIVIRDSEYILNDRQSTHGTFVNGTRVTQQKLKPEDRITFGTAKVEMVFNGGSLLDVANTGVSLFGLGKTQINDKSPLVELEGLKLFLDAARQLNATRVVDDVLITLLDTSLQLTKASRGFVFRVDDAGELHLITGRDTRGKILSDASSISQSILKDAAKSSKQFLITDTSSLADVDNRASIVAHDLRSVLCIPLFRSQWSRKGDASDAERQRALQGVLYLDSNYVTGTLNRTSEDVLTAIATEASALLENARLVEAEQVAQLQRRELEIASSIQQGLMEVKLPETSYAAIEARNIACKDVGGDFYDVVQTPTGLAIAVVDVSGKGVSSALLASTLQGIICAQLESGAPLEQIASWVDRFIAKKRVGGKYATMILARMEPTGKLEYLNCGHVPAALIRGGSVELMNPQNCPVGLVPGMTYSGQSFELNAGDRMVLVTDGITEAGNPEDEEFGLQRFADTLKKCATVDGLFEAVFSFAGPRALEDDCTVVSATYLG